ncbi:MULTISPECIES: cytochrome P450 [Streptomyces]|uniref:Cytochrome P450 n=1 Tax=Streptomyces eurythermus TaxID=42237 RepID=A0ABW6YZW9_9ACTN|nr:cytochrome P450 [Streptomyces sp. DSM 40868]QIS75313.1 cytochrome P450 [Streptomyces sp. DSM 40868]
MGRVVGRSFLEMDGAEHRARRNALHGGFHRQAVTEQRSRVRRSVDARLRALADQGGGDLVGDLAFPVALTTIAGIIGFPPGTRIGTLYTWAVGLLDDADGKIATAVAEWLGTPSAWPARSLVGRLLRHEDPVIGTGPELLPTVRLLLSTGTEPPFRSLATLMYAVLSDPALLETARATERGATAVIQECRRWECPLTWVLRRCSTDTDRLDIHRRPLPHLAMGTGPHICLGRHLAALEAGEILAGLARMAPRVGPGRPALDTDGVEGRGFRSPRRLILRW